MAWKKPQSGISQDGNMQMSLINDSSDISHYAAHSWEMDSDLGVEAWGARVEAFDSRVYPIINDRPEKLAKRLRLIRKVRLIELTFDRKRLRRAYNAWFRFLNDCLIRIQAYPDGSMSHFAKRVRKFKPIIGVAKK